MTIGSAYSSLGVIWPLFFAQPNIPTRTVAKDVDSAIDRMRASHGRMAESILTLTEGGCHDDLDLDTKPFDVSSPRAVVRPSEQPTTAIDRRVALALELARLM